jgi:hypothetical protein
MTPTPASAEAPAPRLARRRPWWVLLAVFVGGLVVGVLLVGLLSAGTPDFVTQSRENAASASPEPSAGVEVAAEARVNAACLRVINEAQDVYSALSGLDAAVTDVDLSTLDDIVRRLQPLEPRLARDLQACEVVVEPAGGGTPGAATPRASPVVPTPGSSATR